MKFPLWYYVEMKNIPDDYTVQYKECDIYELTQVSKNYWLLTVKIPSPVGGTHTELVYKDEEIDLITSEPA